MQKHPERDRDIFREKKPNVPYSCVVRCPEFVQEIDDRRTVHTVKL